MLRPQAPAFCKAQLCPSNTLPQGHTSQADRFSQEKRCGPHAAMKQGGGRVEHTECIWSAWEGVSLWNLLEEASG